MVSVVEGLEGGIVEKDRLRACIVHCRHIEGLNLELRVVKCRRDKLGPSRAAKITVEVNWSKGTIARRNGRTASRKAAWGDIELRARPLSACCQIELQR